MAITLDGTNGITSPNVSTSEGPVYDRGNILGTVTEAAGVPTGAIIERGSNANGEFVKYADGTQICWVSPLTLTQANADRMSADWTFPASFINTNTSVVSGLDNRVGPGDRDIGTLKHESLGTASVFNSVFRTQGATRDFESSDTATIYIIAIGRWF